eukprot:TRINITY_DN4726_c0_g2_i3.p1 TRINITY_DN4726_c0_g2~~TRINITY_DN4726_c0_g2_i3.p1  ORF type:complete len:121 (+),score=3.31 TRINITY_DN4726_c0_g2_i3:108-470(+)
MCLIPLSLCRSRSEMKRKRRSYLSKNLPRQMRRWRPLYVICVIVLDPFEMIASSELINKSELPGFLKKIDAKLVELLTSANASGVNWQSLRLLSILIYLALATFIVFAREDFLNVLPTIP